MSIAINLSPTLTDQLRNQAAMLGISLNELIEKLIYKSLSRKPESESQSEVVLSETTGFEGSPIMATHNVANTAGNGRLTMAEIVARARARPRNPNSIHPPTGTLDDVLAAVAAKPAVSRLTPEEWETHWWPIRQEMRERDSAGQNPFDMLIERNAST